MDNWISVKDRLPENSDEVLINYAGDVIQAFLECGDWRGSRNVTDCMDEVDVRNRTICRQGSKFDFATHWMPLPEPPTQ